MFSLEFSIMDDNFTVHLVSNVSPGLFPENNATKFSTNLADELNLSEGEWEVGVRQIMHPTRIATTSDEDKIHIFKYKNTYRDLFNTPPVNATIMEEMRTTLDLSPPKDKVPSDMVNHVLNIANNSIWGKKDIFRMEFNKAYQKFIINIYHEDVVVWMDPPTRKYLGFKRNRHAISKGCVWAWSVFRRDATPPTPLELHFCDLTTLEKQTFDLTKVWNEMRGEYFYGRVVYNEFKDTLPKSDDLGYPCFSFGVYPHEGMIRKYVVNSIPIRFKNHEKKIAFFQFDGLAYEALEMNEIYSMDDFKGDKRPPTKYSPHYIDVLKKPVLVNESFANNDKVIALQTISVTFFYAHLTNFDREVEPKPMRSISIKEDLEMERPSQMLPLLNQSMAKYGYMFSWDDHHKRFVIAVGNDYVLSLSDSLRSILGFEETKYFHSKTVHRASDFPLLKRAVTALYVYSNIVDCVYIGDVKAPLLLTCPFKRSDSYNIVNQQEFLNPCYAPLNRSRISQIDIAIHDDSGSLIPFLYGKTKLSLDFRKKR